MEDQTVYSELCLLLMLLLAHFPNSHATYSVFISTSELEKYYQGTPGFENVRGLSVDIIRDGISLVLEDGFLQLVPSEGDGGPTESTTDSELDYRMSAPSEVEQGPTETPGGSGMGSKMTAPFRSLPPIVPSQLPSLPPHVDSMTFSWLADINVTYALSLSGDLFKEIVLNVSSYGSIPMHQSGFSIRFPCSDNVSKVGTLWVNLTTSTVPSVSHLASDEEVLVTSFMVVKECQANLSSGMPFRTISPSEGVSPPPAISTAFPSMVDSGEPTPTGSVTPTPAVAFTSTGSVTPTPVEGVDTSSSSSSALLLPYLSVMPESDSSIDGVKSAIPATSFMVSTAIVSPSFSPTPLLSTAPPTPLLSSLSSPLPPPSPLLPPYSLMPEVSQSVMEVMEMTTVPPSGGHTTPPSGGSSADKQFVVLLLLVFSPVVCVLILSISIVCCSICICIHCCKKSKRHFNDDPVELAANRLSNDNYLYPVTIEMDENKYDAPISLWMALPWGSVSSLPAGIQGVIKSYNMDRRSLSILTTVSRGDFGCIVNGHLSMDQDQTDLAVYGGNRVVMMKMYTGFQKQYGHRDEIIKFLGCSTLLHGLDHPNVHSVLHISMEDNYVPVVVYACMEYGNLHQFLSLCRITPMDSPLNPITIQHMVCFAFQIACGMKHLCEKGIIHPDVALRNCYLDTNYQVKVTDGALSSCFYPECYHTVRGTVRPVRWAAIETLQEGLCTSRSNVWSYGVTLWEVMTLSKLPYCAELDHNRCVLSHLLMGNRLAQPEDCPDNLYSLMMECWNKSAENRPSLISIHSAVSDIYSKYAAIQSTVASTSYPLTNTNYSTFGKDLRPQLSVESVVGYSSHRRRRSISQRNVLQGDRLSITFSVLSDDNYLDQSSESEEEGLERRELTDMPAFIMSGNNCEGELDLPTTCTDMERSSPIGSPMNGISTFLSGSNVSHSILDHTSGISSFHPSHAASGRHHSPPPAHIAPPDITAPTMDRSQRVTHTKVISDQFLRPLAANDTLLPPCQHLASSNTATTSSILVAKRYSDTASKASTLDSITTLGSVSGANCNAPSCHNLEIPSSTYNSTSVSIDEVRLRNKSLLLENGQTGTGMPSSTHSATSKSDSGIRSDDEADLMLSNGPLVEAPKRVSSSNRKESDASLGISNLSSDLMNAFASWGK